MPNHPSAPARESAEDPGLRRLHDLLERIPVAMVTTIAADGALHARPMLLERIEHRSLVFLTHHSSTKATDLQHDARVNAAFVSDRGDRYVSVSGTASVCRDSARMRALWNPTYRAWFPHGPDDPDAAILTVTIDRVDYWDVPTSRMVRLWSAVKAVATGQVVEAGEHATIDFRDAG